MGERDELWTYNAKDFRAIGLAERHIVDLAAGRSPVELAIRMEEPGA